MDNKTIHIALAGNPNSGKTTLFNALTGSNQFVGNWPGVTVEKKEGKLKKHEDVFVTDLPGIRGVPFVLCTFFTFCAFETTAGLWASSYLVEYRAVGVETAARFAALFYLGETFGRFLNGFVADRFGDRRMIRAGIITMLAGVVLIALPLGTNTAALLGLVIIGLGAAPVYPCIIHSTPSNFGRENSQSLVGIQMASAYCGSALIPPLFGVIASCITIGLYPAYLAVFAALMLIMSEKLNKSVSDNDSSYG